MSVGKAGHLKVEAGIIYENKQIGTIFQQITPAFCQIASNSSHTGDDLYNPHYSSRFIMVKQSTSYSRHQISTAESELSRRILLHQSFHQIGAM